MDAVGGAVREGRSEKGWTQTELAHNAGVGRRFIVDLEAGHMRAELGKVLSVLEALDIHAVALPSIRSKQKLADVNLKESLKRFG